ncbi:response regulator transcription factor [Fictibacillus sp. BK138]|uniref:response regulator transcription factor n=1 Tax=Fictibacillus sp. BK138 TaxID=2512121 RepID=UPI0010291D74|nr:response regulator transcription factor [Fictibacillus sp. BK138]RZT15553.1 DNA-binding NarL/FixJ family response regulator [Fictibacillus sp. BK138]
MRDIFIFHPFSILRKGLYSCIQNNYKDYVINQSSSFEDYNTDLIQPDDVIIIYLQFITDETLHRLNYLQKNKVKIIIWMDFSDETTIRSLFQKGFLGYLINDIEEDEILKAIENAFNDTPYLHPRLSSLLLKEYLYEIHKEGKEDVVIPIINQDLNRTLTKREKEVLICLTKGYGNSKIAKELYLTENTVKNHVSAILHKLKVKDRTAAVVLAIKNEWILYDSVKDR